MTIVRTLISIFVIRKWPLFQINVKNGFLYGHLIEEVYMSSSKSYSSSGPCLSSTPCTLWFEVASLCLVRALSIGSYSNWLFFSCMWMTWLLLVQTSLDIDEAKKHIFLQFEMKDLGLLRYFLGIEVTFSLQSHLLSQSKYANELIHRATIELHAKFSTSDGLPLDDPTIYHELVSCFFYLIVTCPDIAYVVHVISHFVFAPRTNHWTTLLRILRYIQGWSSRVYYYHLLPL